MFIFCVKLFYISILHWYASLPAPYNLLKMLLTMPERYSAKGGKCYSPLHDLV